MLIRTFSAKMRGSAMVMLVAGGSGVLCTFAHAAEPPPAADSLSPALTVGVAIPAGQIDRAIEQLDDIVAEVRRRTGIPGIAVAVVEDGKPVYLKGFGVRQAGVPETVDPDTVFQLASVSKPVASTVVAREVGQHVVEWNTPIVSRLPWFALGDDWITRHVTIADMFAHRSGLPDHAGDDLEDIGYDRRQVLERLRALPLHSFRDAYAYTNFGLTAAAEAVAAAAGMEWADLSQAAIYGPLGMTSTSSRFADFEGRANRAVGHIKVEGVYEPKYQRQPDAQSPAGGVSSSVRDMARWMAMVLQDGRYDGAQIVAADALLPAVTGQIIATGSSEMAARVGLYGYGFGVGIQPSGRVTVSHSGGFALGAATNFVLIPSIGVGIIALSNAGPIGAVETITASFSDMVQFGSVTRDWLTAYGQVMAPMMAPFGSLRAKVPPARPAPAAALQTYVGRYQNDYYGDAEIALRSDGLVLRLGPAATEFPLRHWDGDVFVYTPTGENAPEGSIAAATFTPDPAGGAATLKLEMFASSGRGDFSRRVSAPPP